MSHRFVHKEFPKGRVDTSGQVTPNGCLAQDLIVSRIQELLAADSKVKRLTKGRVFRFDVGVEVNWGDLPAVIIAPQSIDPTYVPSNLASNQIETVIQLWYQSHGIKRLDPYEPSVATLMAHIESVLASNAMLPVVLSSGPEVCLASQGRALARFDGVGFAGSQQSRSVYVRELVWLSQSETNLATGQIKDVENAL